VRTINIKEKSMKRALKMTIFSAVAFLSTACPEWLFLDPDPIDYDCIYDGVGYYAGESFPDVDGCNTCICEPNGLVSCTLMACVDTCVYEGEVYMEGESFEAGDGCNTCSCLAGGRVVCTKRYCPEPLECEPPEQYYVPGCEVHEGGVAIEPGCYAPCEGEPCEDGLCQKASINPCYGSDCDACSMDEWLCLDAAPKCCLETTFSPMIKGGGRSFGMCIGDCDFDVYIEPGAAEEMCERVVLDVCDSRGDTGCRQKNMGNLTPLGQTKATGFAAELLGVELQKVYGCPDCADGGASQLTIRRDGKEIEIEYEWRNPPDILKKADAFTQGIIDALYSCVSNKDIEVDADCAPGELYQ
jgi:hypothetical protein